MATLKLIAVLLLLAYANGDITALLTKYNSTIVGKCTPDLTTTTMVTTTVSATTATTDTTMTTGGGSGRKKRSAPQLLCVTEETNVIASNNVTEFHTYLQAYAVCQKANCTSLTSAVDVLLSESGATSVKVCGILMSLMIMISYFG